MQPGSLSRDRIHEEFHPWFHCFVPFIRILSCDRSLVNPSTPFPAQPRGSPNLHDVSGHHVLRQSCAFHTCQNLREQDPPFTQCRLDASSRESRGRKWGSPFAHVFAIQCSKSIWCGGLITVHRSGMDVNFKRRSCIALPRELRLSAS